MSTTPSEGDAAPEIDLPTDGGGRFKLSDHRGAAAVIYFYPKDDTEGCTKEAIDFTAHAPEFEAAGVTVVGISPDGVASHETFKAKHGLGIPLAADEEKAAAEAYGVWVEKSMYGRQFMGVQRSTFLVGPDGRIARAWPNVKVPGHVEEVLTAARALRRGG